MGIVIDIYPPLLFDDVFEPPPDAPEGGHGVDDLVAGNTEVMGYGDGGGGILHVMTAAHGEDDAFQLPVSGLHSEPVITVIDADIGSEEVSIGESAHRSGDDRP